MSSGRGEKSPRGFKRRDAVIATIGGVAMTVGAYMGFKAMDSLTVNTPILERVTQASCARETNPDYQSYCVEASAIASTRRHDQYDLGFGIFIGTMGYAAAFLISVKYGSLENQEIDNPSSVALSLSSFPQEIDDFNTQLFKFLKNPSNKKL